MILNNKMIDGETGDKHDYTSKSENRADPRGMC